MNKPLVTAKCSADIPESLRDSIVCTRVDGNITAVTFQIGDKFVKVEKNGSYSENLKLLVEAPVETVTKYNLVGTVAGIDISVNFNTEREAEDKKYYFEAQGDVDLKIVSVEVEVEQSNF